MNRYKKISFYLVGCTLLANVSCSPLSDFKRIPRNGFLTHYEKSDHKRMPFDSYWDVSDNQDWDERVTGKSNKSQAIYVAPVTLQYFENMPADARELAEIQKLKEYFDARLNATLTKLDAENANFHLVKTPTPDAYKVEIAILSAKHENKMDNIASVAAGLIVKGGGLLVGSSEDKGYISMGARYYAPNGKLVAEVGDFEYGQRSLTGMVLVDSKDFRTFAYQRQTIDQWVEEFAKLFTTRHEEKVKKPWFTLNPL